MLAAMSCLTSVDAARDSVVGSVLLGHMITCEDAVAKLPNVETSEDQRIAVQNVYRSINTLGEMLYPSECPGQVSYRKALYQMVAAAAAAPADNVDSAVPGELGCCPNGSLVKAPPATPPGELQCH